jgi:hypothetical protein
MTEISKRPLRDREIYARIEQSNIPDYEKVLAVAQLRRAEFIGDFFAAVAAGVARYAGQLKKALRKPATVD